MRLYRRLVACLICANATIANAIDFKIDLPSESGKDTIVGLSRKPLPVELSNKSNTAQSQGLNNDNTISESDLNAQTKAQLPSEMVENIILDIPEAPEMISNERQQKEENAAIANSDTKEPPVDLSFPTPQCLKPNVAFWEKVYREADTSDAIIHDRDDLSKIYGIVRLPTRQPARRRAVDKNRDYYRDRIIALAKDVESPRSWNKSQREIAKLFSKNELNRKSLLNAAENLRVQTGLKSRFEEGVQRSLKLIPMIFDTLKQQSLPTDIAFLPHVESSYHQYARSKVGAVGLWQIMPGTMRILAGRKAVSQRTNPYIATQAAAKLLKQNFETTQSWPLALTAYNHGLYGVMRAVKATNSHDLCEIIEKYESSSFRFASSNFYAQFLAARNVAMQRYIQISSRSKHKSALQPLLAASEAYKGKM